MLINLALAYPELLLAVSALVLLVAGAFNPKATGVIGAFAVLSLVGAAAISAFGPHGVAFSGSLKADAAAGAAVEAADTAVWRYYAGCRLPGAAVAADCNSRGC